MQKTRTITVTKKRFYRSKIVGRLWPAGMKRVLCVFLGGSADMNVSQVHKFPADSGVQLFLYLRVCDGNWNSGIVQVLSGVLWTLHLAEDEDLVVGWHLHDVDEV